MSLKQKKKSPFYGKSLNRRYVLSISINTMMDVISMKHHGIGFDDVTIVGKICRKFSLHPQSKYIFMSKKFFKYIKLILRVKKNKIR